MKEFVATYSGNRDEETLRNLLGLAGMSPDKL